MSNEDQSLKDLMIDAFGLADAMQENLDEKEMLHCMIAICLVLKAGCHGSMKLLAVEALKSNDLEASVHAGTSIMALEEAAQRFMVLNLKLRYGDDYIKQVNDFRDKGSITDDEIEQGKSQLNDLCKHLFG